MNKRFVLAAGCAALALSMHAANSETGQAEIRAAIVAGADHAANVLLDAHGESRCDYDLLSGKWSPYEPAWHTGQLIYGLLEAYRVTHDPRYLEKARLAGDWWTSLAVTEPGPLQGMVRAVHGAGINYIVFATVTDGTAGLYRLARVTGEDRYAAVPTTAGRWMLKHMYVPQEGVFYDAVDPRTGEVQTARSPFWKEKAAQTLFDVARPNNEGSLFRDMYLYTHDEAFKAVFLALCESLVAKQGPEGLWMRFTPNHAADGGFHPRFNLWYAESLLDGYEMTHDPRYLAAARKTLLFYTKYQRKNGTIYYENFLDGRTNESSPSGSTVAFAGLLWLRLIQLGAGDGCEEPMQRSLAWVLHNRYPTDHPDPNLAGGFFNLRVSGKGPTMHVVYRDIGTAFALRFLAAYDTDRFHSEKEQTANGAGSADADTKPIVAPRTERQRHQTTH